MFYTRIRNFDREVSVIGFGTRSLSKVGTKAGVKAVRRALDLGINLVDTAPNYGSGEAESILGEAIKHRRQEVILCTKAGLAIDEEGRHTQDSRPDAIRETVEGSLQRLHAERIDILTIHYPDPMVRPQETIGALQELIEEGKVFQVGVSNFDRQTIEEWTEQVDIVTTQAQYNILLRDIEEDILSFCRQRQVTVLGYMPLFIGLLTERLLEEEEFGPEDVRSQMPEEMMQGCREVVRRLRGIAQDNDCTVAQLALAWVLSKEGVLPLVGSTKLPQVEENAEAVDLDIGGEALKEMERVASEVDAKVHFPLPMKVEKLTKGYDGSTVGVLTMGFKMRLPPSARKGDTVLIDPWTGKIIEKQ